MKIILSRKGFDSANGGIVSPIFENGDMISFPIPDENDKDTYSQLQYNSKQYTDLLKDLGYRKEILTCHVDPDLDERCRTTPIDNWEALFGQIGASASYLKNCGVKEGDIFLFFGNFHSVIYKDEKYQYVKNSGDFYRDNDLQVIWGYMQIGEIIREADRQKELYWHPHSLDFRVYNNANRPESKNNTIFRAAEHLSFDTNLPGAGLLTYDVKRVLTQKGCPKATWKANPSYDENHIYGNRHNSSKYKNGTVYYSGIWQELCLIESEESICWAESVIL